MKMIPRREGERMRSRKVCKFKVFRVRLMKSELLSGDAGALRAMNAKKKMR